MAKLPPRNRVIYQSEALFISPDATGKHIYYMPPLSASKVTGQNSDAVYQQECFITGSGAGGGDIVFDACAGTGVTNGLDYKFKMYNCTGELSGQYLSSGDAYANLGSTGNGKWFHWNDTRTEDQANRHVVLADNNMLSGINGNAKALAKMGNGVLGTPRTDDVDTNGVWGSAIEQLKRVQNANYSFTINRQDVNQFGQLSRIDAVVLEAPTVSLDFSYYVTDGENERLLGFVTDGKFQNLSGLMTREQNNYGNNYFILTVPEGRDAIKGDQLVEEENKTVIALGNGYVTDYSMEASVGAFPTASVTVEGMNIKSDVGTEYKSIPSIDPQDGTQICEKCFVLPPADTGYGVSVLKPGDITIDMADSALISKQISGRTPGYGDEDAGSAHIQSFTLSTPLGRAALQRLGNTYSFAKEVDFPVTATLSVNALVADLKDGNLVDLVCGGQYDMQIRIQNPSCVVCDPNDNADGMIIDFKKAVLDSESFSSAIGDNKTVDLTFSTQIGGPEQAGVGVFISGFENVSGADLKTKMSPNISAATGGFNNQLRSPGEYFARYGKNGTTGKAGQAESSRGSFDNSYLNYTPTGSHK